MTRVRRSFLAGAVLALAAACSKVPDAPSDADLVLARQLLADRKQPWWNGHALPSPGEPLKIKMADVGDWTAMNYNPPGTPVLPFVLARIIQAGSPILKDSPFAARPVVFVDVRARSDFYVEHVPGSRNVPVRELHKFPEDLDRKSILVVTGEVYPHHEVMARARSAGFDTVYCLEGGFKSWKARGYPLEGRADASEFRRLLEAEREPSPGGPTSDLMGLGPLALKSLMEAGADVKIVFVGDEQTFAAAHIQGSTRVALADIEAAFRDVPKDRLIAVYCGCCQGRAGGYSEAAARRLRQLGYSKVLHLDGHLSAWREAGYPVAAASSTK
jgi:rhodanese-related sulfurtransferase